MRGVQKDGSNVDKFESGRELHAEPTWNLGTFPEFVSNSTSKSLLHVSNAVLPN
jgi:hypothetical protein